MVPSLSTSKRCTSSGVRTTGKRLEAFADSTSSSQGSSLPSTSLYRKSSALFAWFCVDAATRPVTARWVRKDSPSRAPISRGCRLLWKRMKRRTQSQ
ncbi:MAG: hypothetical protein AW07_03865 [Candidatus Accumulibacter sp. SK-11]|nr:MAG: hypothetical protein AW07_03865 [Candidatus Accumulibacter sp. SK-11]